MGDYKIVFELFIIIIFVILVFFFGRLIASIIKTKRLEDFSITSRGNEFNLEKSLWKIVHKISNMLNYVLFIEDISKKYEKYIKNGEEEYKRPIDYMTVKILFALLMGLLYLFETGLHGLKYNFIVNLLFIIFGFLFPNILFMLEDNKKRRIVSGDILKCVIIMGNSFRAGRNAYHALSDVIDRSDGAIKEEFLHIRNDVEHGLSLGDAFYKSYERVPDKDILYLANVLMLVSKNGTNINVAFENVEKTIVNKKRERETINDLKRSNRIFRNIMMFIPLIFFLIVIILGKDYQMLLFGTKDGLKIVIIEVVIYLVYVSMINWLVRRN